MVRQPGEMRELEQLLGLFVAAVILAGAARRLGAPYPVFLALGGALLAFLPAGVAFTLPPELALALFVADGDSPMAEAVRQEFAGHMAYERAAGDEGDRTRSAPSELRRRALHAARQAVIAMRANDEIGDDAFHRIEEDLDWLEMAGGRNGP
jgi:hypothetical protein